MIQYSCWAADNQIANASIWKNKQTYVGSIVSGFFAAAGLFSTPALDSDTVNNMITTSSLATVKSKKQL